MVASRLGSPLLQVLKRSQSRRYQGLLIRVDHRRHTIGRALGQFRGRTCSPLKHRSKCAGRISLPDLVLCFAARLIQRLACFLHVILISH